MPKRKIIKLNKADREEMNLLHQAETVAYSGVATAIKLHYEANETLWKALWRMVPEMKGLQGIYNKGVVTYTPREG